LIERMPFAAATRGYVSWNSRKKELKLSLPYLAIFS
jgi:hypothetical protein